MKNTKEEGLTLIALIVAVLILLIIVGVSISIANGDGLFSKARSASETYKVAANDETKILGEYENFMQEYTTGGSTTSTYTVKYNTSYVIGTIVELGGEEFYVVENSDSSSNTVKLISKFGVSTSDSYGKYIQYEKLAPTRFDETEPYSNDYASSTIKTHVDNYKTAVESRMGAGKKVKEARLMTCEEYAVVKDYNWNVLRLPQDGSKYLGFWLSDPGNYDGTVKCAANNPYYDFGNVNVASYYGNFSTSGSSSSSTQVYLELRPILIVEKDMIENGSEEVNNTPAKPITYASYVIGSVVNLGNEEFYVVENSNSSSDTVKLISKFGVSTTPSNGKYIQYEKTAPTRFDETEPYSNDYASSTIKTHVDNYKTAVESRMGAGKKVKEARLMTCEEYAVVKDYNWNVLRLPQDGSNNLGFWLSDPGNDEGKVKCAANNPYYDFGNANVANYNYYFSTSGSSYSSTQVYLELRPILIVEKDMIENGSEEVNNTPAKPITYASYVIGSVVNLGNEEFYVVENSNSSSDTVKLISKFGVSTTPSNGKYIQYEKTAPTRFDETEPYSNDYASSTIKTHVDNYKTAVESRMGAGKKVKEARLMTSEEYAVVKDYSLNILILPQDSGRTLGFWLSDPGNNDGTVKCAVNPYYDFVNANVANYNCYFSTSGSSSSSTQVYLELRPILIVEKNMIENGSKEVDDTPANPTTYASYEIGSVVNLGNEDFYVVENSNSSSNTVKLISKLLVSTISSYNYGKYIQIEDAYASATRFDETEPYSNDYASSTIKTHVDNYKTAVESRMGVGKKIKEARLMTSEEYAVVKDSTYRNILAIPSYNSKSFGFWLSDPGNDEGKVKCAAGPYYDFGNANVASYYYYFTLSGSSSGNDQCYLGLRPLLIVEKTMIDN